jgi:hypothetical protein
MIIAVLTSRLADTIPAAAKTAAAGLPEQARQAFVTGLSAAGGNLSGGSGAGITLPSSVPPALAEQIRAAAQQAVHSGFATAASQTILVAAAVLLVGLVATLLMDRGPAHAGGSLPLPAEPAVDVA